MLTKIKMGLNKDKLNALQLKLWEGRRLYLSLNDKMDLLGFQIYGWRKPNGSLNISHGVYDGEELNAKQCKEFIRELKSKKFYYDFDTGCWCYDDSFDWAPILITKFYQILETVEEVPYVPPKQESIPDFINVNNIIERFTL